MKWEGFGSFDTRLVADDGEVLERVRWRHGTSEYIVESTGKAYVGVEAAQKAAEKKHAKPDFMAMPRKC